MSANFARIFITNRRFILRRLTGARYFLSLLKHKTWLLTVLRRTPVRHVAPPVLATRALFGLWGSAEPDAAKMAESQGEEDLKKTFETVDELFSNNENQQIYDMLKPKADGKNANLLWRLARTTYSLAQVAPSGKQKEMYTEAYNYAKEALEIDENNFACHKWYAILLDIVAGLEGTKKRIEQAYVVKEHFKKAHELNPDDATSLHTLGFWHFLFADMPWYQRKVAAVIFASPPTATYQEALDYFDQAEKKDPGFYSMNLLMLGKTHQRMGNKEEAKKALNAVIERKKVTADDQKAFDEATQLLSKLK